MLPKVIGDYSKYPEELREIFPTLDHIAAELAEDWAVFRKLFMDKPEKTDALTRTYEHIFERLYDLYEQQIILSLSRLTDEDQTGGKNPRHNFSLWMLRDRCETLDPALAAALSLRIERFKTMTQSIKLLRNKQLAHFDRDISLGKKIRPYVAYREMDEAIKELFDILNFVSFTAAKTERLRPGHNNVHWPFESTAYKAAAFDTLVAEGIVDKHAWLKYQP